MGFSWQTAIVALLVLAALGYLVRRGVATLKRPATGCGGCGDCPSQPSAGGPPVVQLHTIGRFGGDRSADDR